jgi:chemotaxis methyl-accepting protein methylase
MSDLSELHDRDLSMLRALMLQRTGMDIGQYKQDFVARCIHSRVLRLNLGTDAAYGEYLYGDGDEAQRLLEALSVYHSQFNRDPMKYQALRRTILPEIAARKREAAGRGTKTLRIWSAGCAGGEEPYSIAIAVRETLGDELQQWQVSIQAIDMNAALIEKAAQGIYSGEELQGQGLSAAYIAAWFDPAEDDLYRIKETVRAMAAFSVGDLLTRAPGAGIDIVFCRNVLIYFDAPAARKALLRFHACLNDGGYLILGNSETADDFFLCHYQKVKSAGEFFYRKISKGTKEYAAAKERKKNIIAGLGPLSL